MIGTSLDASTSVCPLYISGAIVHFSKSKKNVESAEVPFSHGDTFSLHVRYKKWHGMATNHEDIVFEPEDMFRECSAGDRREYNKVHKNITIAVELSKNPTTEARFNHAEQLVFPSDETLGLQPTTGEIFRKRPQFRILMIGKSSLIKHAFGVQNATASPEKPGEATIDHEFVLHDSKGLETGSKDNLEIIRDFIGRLSHIEARRRAGKQYVNRLPPRTGHSSEPTQVKVLIVVVFTKYDALFDRVERTLDKSSIKGLSKAAIKELTKNNAKDKLQEVCIAPLDKFAGSGIPHVTVSSGRWPVLSKQLIYKHVGIDASRVDPGVKIKRSLSRFCIQNY
ncbi:hypothetical protein BDR05DRAFT_968643 [Suillus weaverae]|nr:hypothetical protein BDR05DRAFT_968643 [Suillus weaverae]